MDGVHLDSTGEVLSIWGMPYPRGRNEPDEGQYDDQTDVFAASGGASLYRSRMFREIGLFDEDFFAYLEDVDLSFRAQLAGWRVTYVPAAVALHHVSSTSDKHAGLRRFHSTKNFYFLFVKNMPFPLVVLYAPLVVLHSARLMLGSVVRERTVLVYLRALAAAIGALPRMIGKRRAIQRDRKVGHRHIGSMLVKGAPPLARKLPAA
jgi:GT2 family glycosyltransferase